MEVASNQIDSSWKLISIGVLIVLLAWETAAPFFPYFVRKLRFRTVHAFRNLALGVVNALAVSIGLVHLWGWAAETCTEKSFGVLNWAGLSGWGGALVAVLLFDLWTYWWHRLNHEVPLLWRFHQVHHSDPQMDVTTANRFHLGEIVLSSLLRVPVIFLIGAEFWHLALYEVILFPVVQFHHANIRVDGWVGRMLRWFIATPEMHKVHHSRWQPETDSNYTSLLSVWDRVFRTFRLREAPSQISFGLDGYDDTGSQKLRGVLTAPFRFGKPTVEAVSQEKAPDE
tara:strand:- start:1064 stop:1915 length:852 start_codon:yes stop_codon:yes gene_type:complete